MPHDAPVASSRRLTIIFPLGILSSSSLHDIQTYSTYSEYITGVNMTREKHPTGDGHRVEKEGGKEKRSGRHDSLRLTCTNERPCSTVRGRKEVRFSTKFDHHPPDSLLRCGPWCIRITQPPLGGNFPVGLVQVAV